MFGIFVSLLAIAAAAAYYFIRRTYSYWDRLGVEWVPPSFPFGNLEKAAKRKLSMGELTAEFYRSASGPVIGIYTLLRPTLVLCDPELIRNACGRDFKHFYHRGFHLDEENDPTLANVLMSNGEKWKKLRERLSPAFSSGKVKGMFDTIAGCGETLKRYMDRFADTGEPVEVREVCARYATNIIASVAFGLDIDCIHNPNEEFRARGMQMFDTNLRNNMRQFVSLASPFLSRFFKVRFLDREIWDFMSFVVKQNAEYREKNNIVRKDFFELLLNLHRSGSVHSNTESTITGASAKPLTLKEITAEAVLFFGASFETSSSTMSFCLYELAKSVEIQRKVQNEIDAAREITYESVENMKFLESCVEETLRKYPSIPIIGRECTENYQIPDTDVVIEKGTSVLIPVYGLHRDPKYYPEPEKFDPNRFSAENSAGKTFLDRPYMPFGSGQRQCMGIRLGKLQVKIGLILLLQKYNFALGTKDLEHELEFSPKTVILTPISGLQLLMSKR